jgi:uncharacterized C2H2 Zn-finger protein
MLIKANNFTPKNAENFNCELCDFVCSKKSDYTRHVMTLKHQKANFGYQNANSFTPKNAASYKCEICEIHFRHISSLSRHKKKRHTVIDNDDDDIKMLTHLVLEVVKQNKELTTQNNELANKIVDLSQQIKPTSITNITNTNTNSNNKTFNLNVFLNETCKDAMNIMEFIDSIKIQLSDLESFGKLGYVEGISNIIVKNLKEMDVHKRPVHCSDSKREVMYIKDDNKWEKENENKPKLRKLIKQVAHKNTRLLPQYKEKYPDCDTIMSEQYNKLIIEAIGGVDDNIQEKEDKIIHKIAKEVIIDKINL